MDENEVRQAVLRYLRQVYPARVALKETIIKVAAENKFDEMEVCRVLDRLRMEGMIEETLGPTGAPSSRKVQISEAGLEIVHGEEQGDGDSDIVSPKDIESKLISTYDNMKADMEDLKKNLELNQKELGKVMGELQRSISEHDQFLKTYFVRIMESIGVFIGIFGIVVVMMVSNLSNQIHDYFHFNEFVIFIIALPLLLMICVVPTLYLIQKYIMA